MQSKNNEETLKIYINKEFFDEIISKIKEDYHYEKNLNENDISKFIFSKIDEKLLLSIFYKNKINSKELQFVETCPIVKQFKKNVSIILDYDTSKSKINFDDFISYKKNKISNSFFQILFGFLIHDQYENIIHNQKENQKDMLEMKFQKDYETFKKEFQIFDNEKRKFNDKYEKIKNKEYIKKNLPKKGKIFDNTKKKYVNDPNDQEIRLSYRGENPTFYGYNGFGEVIKEEKHDTIITIGNFIEGNLHGFGSRRIIIKFNSNYINQTIRLGIYDSKNGVKSFFGEYEKKNGNEVITKRGNFIKNNLNGFGEYISEKGENKITKIGNFINGELDGYGKQIENDDKIQIVIFKNGGMNQIL